MKLKKLQLENFRTYETYTFEFPQDRNLILIVGDNGKGKTNLLEAVYILSLGRSFRSSHPENLIQWGSEYFRCKAITDNEDTELEVFFSTHPQKKKNFKKNDITLKNSEYIGSLPTVLFHPEDLNMLYLSPQYRRKYMDILLSQADKSYLYALIQYKRVLKQRNALLKEIAEKRRSRLDTNHLEGDLDAWDSQIINFGTEIVKKRLKLADFLKNELSAIYSAIAGEDYKISLKYLTKLPDSDQIEEVYATELIVRRDQDIRDRKTTFGPHLDDLKFSLNGRDLLSASSRGEIRTLLLAVKFAEILFIEAKTQEKPVLLLDDVFSELDLGRQKHLLAKIQDYQTIITSTDIPELIEAHTEVVRL